MITQADGTLEASSEDAPSPRPNKRPRIGGGSAPSGTAGDSSAQGAPGMQYGAGGESPARQGAANDRQSVESRATESDPSRHHSPLTTIGSARTSAAGAARSGRPVRAASRLGNGDGGGAAHATARSASVGERRSIQVLLSAVVEELHRHESEPAGGARLTLDEPPGDSADAAAVVSASAEVGSRAVVSPGQEDAGPEAEPRGSRDAGASAGDAAGAPHAETCSGGEDGVVASLPPGSTAPAGARRLLSEASQLADPCPPEGVTEPAPSPALPRRGPQPPVSPFATLQSSGSLPDKEATETCAVKASPMSARVSLHNSKLKELACRSCLPRWFCARSHSRATHAACAMFQPRVTP